ncbi:DUF2020 domain-containing protein [Nakamurella antarctica]|uniref:DUF2020 domain-containing protein n=1 Tax=Nakamurella antarctica TaxID=1902245 RepID=A0A3G8ZS65_9ACTN|nr:DUF2020 domain-containing protein [Nakamurella antarctica]
MKKLMTAVVITAAMLVAGCSGSSGALVSTSSVSTLTAEGSTASTAESSAAEPSAAEPSAAESSTAEPSAAEPSAAEPSAAESSAAESSTAESSAAEPSAAEPSTAPTTPAAPASYTPPPDAQTIVGDCPYLTDEQVESATGQRKGADMVRPMSPQPTCEFVRSDGTYLATVRVLQFATDAEAVAAVDYYVPRETSQPATQPEGWAGGLKSTPDGNVVSSNPLALAVYGVSKGGAAVIATTNEPRTFKARELVKDAISTLGF